MLRHINGGKVAHPPKALAGFKMNPNYSHVLRKTTFKIPKSCHMSHCTARAGSGYNFCIRALKLKDELGEEMEMAPNVSGSGNTEMNRVVIQEHFCRSCELVLHPECSTLWHMLVFMGLVDFFQPTPCWYCQDMVRDAWTAEFPAAKPPGAKSRKWKKANKDKVAAGEEEPAQLKDDAAVGDEAAVQEEDRSRGGGSGEEKGN